MLINELHLQGTVTKAPEKGEGKWESWKFALTWEGPVGKNGFPPKSTLFVKTFKRELNEIASKLQLGQKVDVKGSLRCDKFPDKKTGADVFWWRIDAESIEKLVKALPVNNDDLPF